MITILLAAGLAFLLVSMAVGMIVAALMFNVDDWY